jgi:bisphosphoglycerate-independent phosphoglycerate mutase (AlkP superfamily)
VAHAARRHPRSLEPNTRKWSGDHAASEVTDTPGVLLASRRLAGGGAAITDLAPTALRFLDVAVPAEMTGRALLEEAQ